VRQGSAPAPAEPCLGTSIVKEQLPSPGTAPPLPGEGASPWRRARSSGDGPAPRRPRVSGKTATSPGTAAPLCRESASPGTRGRCLRRRALFLETARLRKHRLLSRDDSPSPAGWRLSLKTGRCFRRRLRALETGRLPGRSLLSMDGGASPARCGGVSGDETKKGGVHAARPLRLRNQSLELLAAVGCEVGGSGIAGASGFTLRARPRNGWSPNSASFSARRP
jgi:hypothetical protein